MFSTPETSVHVRDENREIRKLSLRSSSAVSYGSPISRRAGCISWRTTSPQILLL